MSDTYRLPLEDEPPPIKGQLPHSYSTEIITDLTECQRLWELFSPNQTIFDVWEFRLAFYLAYQFKLHFIKIFHRDQLVGLWPLWFDSDKQSYDWFGSYWQEHNNIWVTESTHLPAMMAALPIPSKLRCLNQSQLSLLTNLSTNFEITPDDPTFSLNLEKMGSKDDYLQTLKKKKRYNLKRDWQAIEELNPQVFYDRYSDLEFLIELNNQRFLEKGEFPDLSDQRRSQAYRNILILGLENKKYQVKMISLEIAGKLAVVDFLVLYRDIYYSVKGGSDLRQFPGIGNFMNLFEIDDACKLGFKSIDFLQSPTGWKFSWFTPEPLYILNKM